MKAKLYIESPGPSFYLRFCFLVKANNNPIDHGLPADELSCVSLLSKLVTYVVPRGLIPIFIIFSLFGRAPLEAAPAVAWNFDLPGERSGWEAKGVEASKVREGVYRILGKEEFQLILPPGLDISPEKDTYFKIRLRTFSPRYLRIYWQPAGSRARLPFVTIQPYMDQNFHTYWVDLSKSPAWHGKINRVGLIFGGIPGMVEIDSLEIGPFSVKEYLASQWREFWLPRTLNIATINSLNSPRLFGKPFISWLNKVAVIVLVLGAFFYFKTKGTRRIKITLMTGLALLIIWLLYDIRETYSQFKMVDEIYRSYVKPPPENKTFPALGAFHRFIELCREKIPPEAQYHFYSDPYWPYDCRIKYFLYPRRINSDTLSNIIAGKKIPYYVVYHQPGIRFDTTSRQIRYHSPEGDFEISKPGRIIVSFGENSFIFLEEQ